MFMRLVAQPGSCLVVWTLGSSVATDLIARGAYDAIT
jgi:hypothetical protein